MGSFTIVKHAGSNWHIYWEEDPKITGVHLSFSAAGTHTGVQCGLLDVYTDIQSAVTSCEQVNRLNPCGDYAVCKVI